MDFFIHKQDANFANDLITLCGLPVAIIGLYYVPLFTPKAGQPQDRTEVFSAPARPAGALRGIFAQVTEGAAGAYRATPPSATGRVPGVPVSYGLAFFASGVLNFVGGFILLDSNLASHRLQYIQHVVDKCAVVMVETAGTISLLISFLNSFMMMVFAWHMVRWRLPAVPGLGRA